MTTPSSHRTILAAALAGGLGLIAVSGGHAALAAPVDDKTTPRPAQAPSPPVAGETATPPALVAPATIQAFFATDLYAKDSGYISQINADIGDHVKKGDVLAVIDDPELEQQYARAQAAVQQAKAALEVARRRLGGLQADRTLQQVTLKRWEQLFAGKAVTNQQLDEQRAKENVSDANLQVGEADIALSEANLLAANADLQRLQALVSYTKITAPFDGIITRRLANPGDLVQAATTTRPVAALFTCQEIDVVRVFADVPETNAVAMRPGAPAEVRLYGSAGRVFRAPITRVAGALDPTTRTMRVEIDVPNPEEALLPGMYAQVSLWPLPGAAESHAGSQ